MSTVGREDTANDQTAREQALVLWLADLRLTDLALVGSKSATLGELIQQLAPQGIKVPAGFAITTLAYRMFLELTELTTELQRLLRTTSPMTRTEIQQRGRQARSLILETPLPLELQQAIAAAYRQLCQPYGEPMEVAVRSSAAVPDAYEANFAGQLESYLNIHGEQMVLAACHKCFASLFTDRAIAYRQSQGIEPLRVALGVCVQLMVRSDLATAGIMVSSEPATGFPEVVLIRAAYGLGETVAQGTVDADEYLVFKPTLKQGHQPILTKQLGRKATKLVGADSPRWTQQQPVPLAAQQQFALTDAEILQLAHWACVIENHYTQLRQVYTPVVLEWAKDGLTDEFLILQAGPAPLSAAKAAPVLRSYQLQTRSEVLVTGRRVGTAIAQGKVRVILDLEKQNHFQSGEILVTDRTDPNWEPLLRQASAIVTNQGGRACHAAILARELGLPAIVGTGSATTVLQTGQAVTVSCAEGETGRIYAGWQPFMVQEVPLATVPRTHTQILLNLADPAAAFRLAALPTDGVGLVRMEFIIAHTIRVHPLALIHHAILPDRDLQDLLAHLTQPYNYKPDYFVDRLAWGVATIAAAFYPRPVMVRLSDFKSQEYANLLGGQYFEPTETNPALGWRGACRYCDPQYHDAFVLECLALKRVRNQMGLTNVILMVPFCRTPEEAEAVLAALAIQGLVRGENQLQVYVMCELPSNVLLADQFCQLFDGFSIGSNDLTQLTLGLDRESSLVARQFDERHPAVKRLIQMAIATAKQHKRKISFCGQAPSDYPDFARFLVEQGIDSISLDPDALLATILEVATAEGIDVYTA